MRKALAAAVLLACLPAAAQDKGKSDITFNGDFRVRDSWLMNSAAQKDSDINSAYSRFKLNVSAKANDKLSAHLTLLHNAQFGDMNGTNLANTAGTSDSMTVNQAYGSWMASDMFTLKAGRMNYQIGDGTIMGLNDWQEVPYSYEGLLGNYEAEFGRFQVFTFKFDELARTAADGTGGYDPESNLYGLNFDLKTMPEMIKGVNAHVLSYNKQATGTTTGEGQMRYGLNVNLAFNIIDVGLWYEAHSGKTRTAGAAGVKTDKSGSLMAAMVGANLANFMNSKVWVKYHQDTGDKSSSADKNEGYDSFFTEKHATAGHMDVLGFGNLTFIQIGWTGKPMDNTEVGLNYWMFSKTEKTAAVTGGRNNNFGVGEVADKTKIGDELDLWATHKYDNGLSTTLRLGMFMPGDVYKETSPKQDKTINEIFLEGSYSF